MAPENNPARMDLDMSGLKCLQCCGEYKLAQAKIENAAKQKSLLLKVPGAADIAPTQEPVIELPQINDAVTWAPSWQQQQIGPQMVMACVTLPTCMDHLAAAEPSSVLQSGLIPGL